MENCLSPLSEPMSITTTLGVAKTIVTHEFKFLTSVLGVDRGFSLKFLKDKHYSLAEVMTHTN